MSFGSAAMQFEVKHGAKGGIFWQKEPPKQKGRKFGYKSKDLRHPVRRPEPEYIEEPFKKTKPAKDFIRKNREQFKPQKAEEEKENYRSSIITGRPSSEIKPGTVTLTQDQLNALLATVGKLKVGDADGLRVSIDAGSNQLKIETPRGDADNVPNSRGSDKHPPNDERDVESIPGLGRSSEPEPNRAVATNKKNAEKAVRFDSARNKVQHLKPEPEPEPTPIPPAALIPWKHLTVAERKRLQWKREKAAEEELGTFDPWGRPGAGAPMKKSQEPQPPATELITQEEKNLRKAIDDIEAKYSSLLSQTASRESLATKTKPKRHDDEQDSQEKSRRRYNGASPARHEADVRLSQDSVSKGQLEDNGNSRPVKKQQNRTDEQKERKGALKKDGRKRRMSGEEGRGDSWEAGERREKKKEEEQSSAADMKTGPEERTAQATSGGPASMQTSMKIGDIAPDDSQFISKKEEERRRWLEELDKQREEKRLQKQRERDERRAGVDDTWADRFVQQLPPRPSIRMQPQQQTASQQLMAPDLVDNARQGGTEINISGNRTDLQNHELPPAAMRSSMVIGGIAPNDDKIRSKKEEERRLWLEELNRQREEQREARMKLKDQQKASEETWADRFTQDPRTTAVADQSPHTIPSLEPQVPAGYYDNTGGRVSSAPQPQPVSNNEDEQLTHLRGQNVFIDPVTRHELELKRKKHLEYQAAVKAQIEEKERQKREERERKWQEEMEEEVKLQAERDKLQRQLEAEENKHRQKEEARQRQVEQLKHMMDTEQERAKEQKMLNRLTTLQQGGHDIRGLKAHYEAVTPRMQTVSVDPTAIPGLGGVSPRDSYPFHSNLSSYRGNIDGSMGKRTQEISTDPVSHNPYVENRVLTPSRFRKPSQPYSDSMSPRRQFATQTDDIAALIEGLKKELSEVEIEYRPKASNKASDRNTNKQVTVKSADVKKRSDNKNKERAAPPAKQQTKQKQQQKVDGKPPTWNYQNQKRKAPVKQSEKDPFYETKKQESEERRAKRERQLQYLVELNKQVIPTEKYSRLENHPEGDFPNGPDSGRGVAEERPQKHKHTHTHEDLPVANGDLSHRSRSPPARNTGKYRPADRSRSPPVPAVWHKQGKNPSSDFETEYDVDTHNYYRHGNVNQDITPRVDEHGNVRAPVRDGDFVPIMRTQDVLDPSKAEEPLQLSRENTHIKKARQHYHENLHPADFGNQLEVYEDRQRQPATRAKDPILNPSLVKDFPTARQDQILQQLSSLKKSLIQRQRELETCMSPSDFEKQV